MIAALIGQSCCRGQQFRALLGVGVLFVVFASHGFVYAETPNSSPVRYRTASSILVLSPEEASHGEGAQIRGVVTRSTDYGLVVQDRSAGIYVDCERPGAFTSGDEIEVDGVVDPGQFSPIVKARSIRKLGRAPLPRPKEVTFKELSTGDENSQYISITGEIRSAGLRPGASRSQRLWLQIAMVDGSVYVSLPEEEANAASKLVDAVVRVNGAASCTKNQNRQIIAPMLFVAGMQSITVLRPPPRNLFALPLTPISRLMQYRSGTDYFHRVRIAGTVTYFKASESLILEDGGRALFVTTAQTPDIKLGDRVEAVGFPAPRNSGPILEDAVLRDIAPGQQLQPTPVTIADLSSSAFNYNLVSTPVRYQTAASILELSPEQASHGETAKIRGVVTRSTNYGLVVQDRTAGIYIDCENPEAFTAGDEIEVDGVVDPGQFAPIVKAQSMRKLGRAPLPKPKQVTFKELSSGDEICQYVSITGEVRSAGLRPVAPGSQRVWLQIAVAGGFVYVSLPKEDADAGNKLVDAVVRVNGAASSTRYHNRQMNAPTLYVAGMQSITVLRPPPRNLFALPLTPISRLMQYRSRTDYFHRVRVAGTITYFKAAESLILEEGNRALYVTTVQAPNIKLGDRVEAVGFPAPRNSGPIVEDAVLRDIGPGKQLQPTPVTIADLSSGSFNYNLVSTEGRFLRRVQEPYREVLLLQDKSTLLLAELTEPENSNALQKLQEGSTIRISGISMVDITGTWNTGGPGASAVRYKILLRSASDVQVVRPPSWWTKMHIIYIAAILGVLVLLFLGLEIYSRIERWRLEAVLDERERLAHEIHDTLAQSFAGIGFQLQAIRNAIPTEKTGLMQQIDLARELVRHSHKEARRSIEPLRSESPKDVDLLSSLEGSARKMVEGGTIKVTTISAGTPRALPPHIAFSLLRIGQEAIANAVRHADPSHLEISIGYQKYAVQLAIRDDGSGFVESGDLLGFGLRGMRKRSAALAAKMEIASQPGEGTRVEVVAPLPPNLTLTTFIKRTWQHLTERILHVHIKTK